MLSEGNWAGRCLESVLADGRSSPPVVLRMVKCQQIWHMLFGRALLMRWLSCSDFNCRFARYFGPQRRAKTA